MNSSTSKRTRRRRRIALAAAPVNRIVHIIQNTATGPYTSIKATWLDARSAPSFHFTVEIFSFCTHHNSWSRKVNIRLHIHHNQMKGISFFLILLEVRSFASPSNMCKSKKRQLNQQNAAVVQRKGHLGSLFHSVRGLRWVNKSCSTGTAVTLRFNVQFYGCGRRG